MDYKTLDDKIAEAASGNISAVIKREVLELLDKYMETQEQEYARTTGDAIETVRSTVRGIKFLIEDEL